MWSRQSSLPNLLHRHYYIVAFFEGKRARTDTLQNFLSGVPCHMQEIICLRVLYFSSFVSITFAIRVLYPPLSAKHIRQVNFNIKI